MFGREDQQVSRETRKKKQGVIQKTDNSLSEQNTVNQNINKITDSLMTCLPSD